jgi:hypothetical protein
MAAGRQRLLKRAALLLSAFGLLALGGALMLKPAPQRRPRAELEFPRYARAEERERQERRNTLVIQQKSEAPVLPQPEPPAPATELRVDPLQLAISGEVLGVVLEAGALHDSPLGRMLLGCLSPGQAADLAELEQKTGLRPLEQVERIALTGSDAEEPVLVLSGQLGGFDPSALGDGASFEPYGEHALWSEHGDHAVALWQKQLLLLGSSSGVREALARLERPPSDATARLASEAYGEMYGTLSGRVASQLLPTQLRERFEHAAERVTLHVDARDDLLLVADIYGSEPDLLKDLASLIGGAFALGRLQAVRSKEPVLADLLDESRVIPGAGSFQVEMALPLASIAAQLGECARAPRTP